MTRTTTPTRRARWNTEMNVIGYVVGIGVVLVLLPALPLLVVLWVIDRALGGRLSSRFVDRGVRRSREAVEPE